MEPLVYKSKIKIPKIGKIPLYLVLVGLVFLLAVLQDFIYSKIQQTGFYLLESLLYNTFWIFFIPLTVLINMLMQRINPSNKWRRLPLNLGIGITFSFLHLFVFSALFVLVSELLFNPTHRFLNIFNAAFSNQFYIALLWYVLFPAIHISRSKLPFIATQYPDNIRLKIGSKVIRIPTSSIQLITTDKPYCAVYTNDQKLLASKSLKAFERQLDPSIFLRVHRSTIINPTYLEELKSRNNGDYDAKLKNGQLIRLSRHYRNNWDRLLQ